jgi:hypothetical protein
LATECWDAYEAIDGRPFLQAIAQPQPWARVRHWLADLAHEIAHGLKDGSLPPLQADRVWIGSDDRARLLDWPAPGCSSASSASSLPGHTADVDLETAQRFLYGIAAGALRGVDPVIAGQQPPSTPIPAPARALLLSLRDGTFGAADAVETQASAMLRDPATFPRRRRLLQLAVCAIVPVTMTVAVFSAIKLQVRSQTADPDAYKLNVCLKQLVSLDKKDPAALTANEREQRDAIEIYIADHLREAAQDKAGYAKAFPAVASVQRDYRMAERALASHPQRSPDQVRQADEVVARLLASNSQGLTAMNKPLILWGVIALIAGGSAAVVAVLGLIGALATRGGLTLRAFGAALVTADGRDASRLRALLRAVVAWSPLALWGLLVKFGPRIQDTTVGIALLFTLAIALLVAGAMWAWIHPSRGVQDRVAGTWLVPR